MSTSVAATAAQTATPIASSTVVAGQAFAAAAGAVDEAEGMVSPQALPVVAVTAVVVGAYNLVGGRLGARSAAGDTVADVTAFD